jgi:hypothetical protein
VAALNLKTEENFELKNELSGMGYCCKLSAVQKTNIFCSLKLKFLL